MPWKGGFGLRIPRDIQGVLRRLKHPKDTTASLNAVIRSEIRSGSIVRVRYLAQVDSPFPTSCDRVRRRYQVRSHRTHLRAIL